jgi:hypothetical protein
MSFLDNLRGMGHQRSHHINSGNSIADPLNHGVFHNKQQVVIQTIPM